ncbi:MAG: DNA polymerase I [Gammaproteobacteria bacterium]|nr:DNA polymerase I [Gammaproteobacteria bacterium]
MQKPSPLILVDGSAYLYRAFHAMPNLSNSEGEHTGAIYGVINMLRKLLKDFAPKHMAVIFDAKGKTFRDELYQAYKANRAPMPQELREQIQPLHDIIQAMGIPLLVIDGVEADDVIGTLALQACKHKMNTLISTGDKDMAQLVNDHVTLMDTMKDSVLTRDTVIEKFGVPPERIIDYLALMGDKSDNIPGVPNVGPKTAVKWLNQFGSMDGVIKNAGDIKGKAGENLRNAIDQLSLSYQLATIKCDVPLDVTPNDLTLNTPDIADLTTLYSRMEFKTWLSEILPEHQHTDNDTSNQTATQKNYQAILTKQALQQWIEQLQQADLFAFDTETTDLNYMQAEVVGVSFAINLNEAAYVPFAHDYEGAPEQLERNYVLNQLKPLLENSKQFKVGQHLKYDINVLANHDIKLTGVQHDTMLESYVLDSTATRHDMNSLALKYLNCKTIQFEDVAGKGKNQLTFNQVSLEQAVPYAAEDADITLQLHHTLWPKIQADSELKSLYENIEIPLIPVLSRIERDGVYIDINMLAKQSKQLDESITKLAQQAFDIAGEEFNLSSPKQIQTILFDKQGLPILKKTPKGQASTAEEVLQELALDFPLPKLILEHRSLSKLKSTYTDKLPLQVNAKTKRIHTSYHQATASTGRLASKDPNLQNIPIRTSEGRRIRQAFVAPYGCKIVAADYSQIELRIMAHLSGDKGLLQAFANDEDIHCATAAEVFGNSVADVSDEERRRAKAINFGLIYGMSAFGLGKQLGISRTEAQQYIDLYFERYPGVKTFMDETREKARETGFVKTVFGRRLYLPDIKHSNSQRRQYAERTAINAPMQGTAADIIKLAMIKTDHWVQNQSDDIKMIMQVHDELVFEIPEAKVKQALQHIESCMISVAALKVPLKVDIGVGNNWDEAH